MDTPTMVQTSSSILLVEDNPGDVLLIREVFKESRMKVNLSVAQNGEEAINFLFNKTPYEEAKKPDLVILDLNLPRKNGKQVLEVIKKDDSVCCIPVIILTSSSSLIDIEFAYNNHANCFITKPSDYYSYKTTIRTIEHFWFTVVTLNKLPAK